MRREPIPEQDLLEAWPKLGYFQLYDLARRGLDDVGHRSYRLRQRLVASVRQSGLPDEDSRIQLAMGKLRFLDQDSQRSWWDFVCNDLHLVDIATRRGLHVGYMVPEDTGRYLDAWLEQGGGMHRAAQMMWDRAFLCGNQFHLPRILCPRAFNAEHMDQWRDRVLPSWRGACSDAKRQVLDGFAAHGTASPGSEYRARKKWIMRWFEDLLDGSPTTLSAIEECLQGSIYKSGVDQDIESALRAHVSMIALDGQTSTVARPTKIARF